MSGALRAIFRELEWQGLALQDLVLAEWLSRPTVEQLFEQPESATAIRRSLADLAVAGLRRGPEDPEAIRRRISEKRMLASVDALVRGRKV